MLSASAAAAAALVQIGLHSSSGLQKAQAIRMTSAVSKQVHGN
jgi:hypothetical protein